MTFTYEPETHKSLKHQREGQLVIITKIGLIIVSQKQQFQGAKVPRTLILGGESFRK